MSSAPTLPSTSSEPWKGKLLSNMSACPRITLSNEVLQAGSIHVEFPNGEAAAPWITVDQVIREALEAEWRTSVVVKVFGRTVSYPVLDRHLRQLWNPTGRMTILDVPNNYFIVRFETQADFEAALTGGALVYLWQLYCR